MTQRISLTRYLIEKQRGSQDAGGQGTIPPQLRLLLEVGARIALMPSAAGYRNEWESLLHASGTANGFAKKYGDAVQRNLESWFFFDSDNASSVM